MDGIFLTAKDLQKISGFKSYASAWRYLQLIKDSIGKKKHQHITLGEFCNYEGIQESEVLKII